MKIAFGADESTHLTDALVDALRLRGHEVELFGPPAGGPKSSTSWADVARDVGERVAMNRAEQGVLCCWTGTGVSIAANKVPGVRAALCADAETARGARLWNDANVLAMGLRLTSEAAAIEMIDAFLATDPDDGEAATIARVE